MLITHTPLGHIQGFPSSPPIYVPGNELSSMARGRWRNRSKRPLMFQMQYKLFPVRGVELAARVKFTELGEETFNIGDLEVSTKSMNTPSGCWRSSSSTRGSRSSTPGAMSLTMMSCGAAGPLDTGDPPRSEFIKECNQRVVDFCRGSDMLIADSSTPTRIRVQRGWGHSSISHV